ncbi:MAG TPA: response regulator [Candidatus Sulfotelmatobacter sp.]|nr:response regulator [Candidatus Sulfotelmatobacter sp.]
MRILVIEDSRLLRSAIERTLSRAEYEVVAIGDGQEGLSRAQDLRPDMILLDMMLPTMVGTGVLRQLKQNPLTKSIPVIILSGLSQKNETKLKKAGASAYFEKSLLHLDKGGSELLKAVQKVVAELPGTKDNSAKTSIAGFV